MTSTDPFELCTRSFQRYVATELCNYNYKAISDKEINYKLRFSQVRIGLENYWKEENLMTEMEDLKK